MCVFTKTAQCHIIRPMANMPEPGDRTTPRQSASPTPLTLPLAYAGDIRRFQHRHRGKRSRQATGAETLLARSQNRPHELAAHHHPVPDPSPSPARNHAETSG
jgi:hypothetical protein